MKKTLAKFTKSLALLLVCISMFVGSTFAWFTDSVTSGNNVIVSGNLDVEMYWADALEGDETIWYNVETADTGVFASDNWEPGRTEIKYIKVVNNGNLALKYQVGLLPMGEIGKLAEVIDVYYAQVAKNVTVSPYTSKLKVDESMFKSTLVLADMANNKMPINEGVLLPKNSDDDSVVIAIALHMQETAGNEYQNETVGDGFGIQVLATQHAYESDSFGSDYDNGLTFPNTYLPISVSKDVTQITDGLNELTEQVEIKGPHDVMVTLDAGTKVDGTGLVTLKVQEKENSDSDVNVKENEELKAFDVHIEGLAEDNTKPAVIEVGKVLPTGLNKGNLTIYHLEQDTIKLMKEVSSVEELSKHNQFVYEPADGSLTLYMASFSEVTMVADTEKAWEGNFDYSWYDASKTELTIANADQLAAFGAIVGGMVKNENGEYYTRDSFFDKKVKLVSDINLGDKDNAKEKLIFHPIGYYYKDGDSTVKSFEGTFDGNGHTIANFYQNTWEIKGDYDGTYYKDAMGLFGYVNGGTVKNLTVDNFSSDGEFTPTGVIAAYADGDAKFENIAITKCNPRVYNTGNGGIIGIAGSTSAANDDHITLKNITVDNSNKISALWGSWDVACGGLVGMYRGNVDGSGNPTGDTISFENCHVAAQIDVYNDVCANYQYYAYRYSGMIIGSVRHNTNKDGKTIPNMEGISATGCTVNYGDWNDYYYCEFEKNTMASYSDDYQFSREPLSEFKFTDSNENGIIDTEEERNSMECLHGHTDAEDNRAVYLPFHQLFTGYSWGVSNIGLKEYGGIQIKDLDIKEDEEHYKSVVKFESDINELVNNKIYEIGSIFVPNDQRDVPIKSENVQVTVSPADENSNVSGTFTANTTDWTKGTIILSGNGNALITVTDYYYCTPTTITVAVSERQEEEKFVSKFNNKNFLYRVGNQNEISVGSLFASKDEATINNSGVVVTIDKVDENSNVSGSFTANTTEWAKGTIEFKGTGKVKVTIQDYNFCTPTELYLEVIEAVNATSATSAKSNNVVLLNDCGFSSLEVSGGYTLFGNGFTMTCGSDSPALDMGYSFVTLNNGTLDNVQIICPNFDYAVLYKSNMTESGNRSQTTDKTRYYNVKSGVMVSGNSQILNSRISGARAAVNVTGGNVIIDNSKIELGAVASILVGSANKLTLRDVTLVQKPTASTYDPKKTLMGFSVLILSDSNGNSTPIVLEGDFKQNAWANKSYQNYVPEDGQKIITNALSHDEFKHDIVDEIDGNESINLGFAYMPEVDDTLTFTEPVGNIEDKRINNSLIPYGFVRISAGIGYTKVYSYKNTNGTLDAYKTETNYEPNKNGDIITVAYSDTADGLELGKSFGTDGWVNELNVDLDKLSGYAIDFSKLSMSINGTVVTDFKVNGSAKPTSPVAVTSGGTTYTLTSTVNGKEYTATFKVTGTETSKESPSKISGPTTAGFGVAKSYGGDWSGAADVLTGVKIKYWSVAENKYVEFDFSNFTVPGSAGKLNGTNSYWEYTHTNNDFTLKVTNTVAIHSGRSVYGMPIRGTDGKLYFTISSTNGYVGSGTTSRSITMQYEFTDNNGGEKLTFTHTFDISYSKNDQYSYSDLSGSGKLTKLTSNSGGSSDTCVTPETLITLADGSQVEVQYLTGNEELLVWNLETGKYDKAPIVFVDSDEEAEYEIIHLYFSDGTDVEVISEHGFFDTELGKYVYLDSSNAKDYIGHRFVKKDDISKNTWETVELVDVVLENRVTRAYSPVTYSHLVYYVDGMLSMPGGIDGLFNIYEVNVKTMKYNAFKKFIDILKYGQFSLEDFGGMIPEEAFYAFNGKDLKVAIGKGLLTWEDIAAYAERYVPLMK